MKRKVEVFVLLLYFGSTATLRFYSFDVWSADGGDFLVLLLQNTVLSSEARIFALRQGEAERDREVVAQAYLRHFLANELIDAFWRLKWVEVTVAELANLVRTPRVARAAP